MSRTCPDDRIIFAAVLGEIDDMSRDEAAAAADVLDHVANCEACSRLAEIARKLDAAYDTGVDDESFRTEMQRHIERVLAGTRAHRWPSIAAQEPSFHQDEIVTYLLSRADAVSTTNARLGADYAAAAAAIAEKLFARHAVPPERLIDALKDHATHLREAGSFGTALAVLASAESVADSTDDPTYHRAVLKLCRAMLLADSNVCRLDEAEALASECERDLAGRDLRRAALATFTRAAARRRRGDAAGALLLFREARAVFVKAHPEGENDVAFCDEGIATCLVDIGRPAEARPFIVASKREFRRRDLVKELLRLEWLSARCDSIDGDDAAAITKLHDVARSFLALRLLDEWVRVRLDIVSITLGTDPCADVTDLCESIAAMSVSLDEREPNRSRRCTCEALEHLRQMALRRSVTAELAQYVRRYIAVADSGQIMPFAPPTTLVM